MKCWANISSLGHFLETIAFISENWKRSPEEELWFRAEDESHYPTRLQPGLYRPRQGIGPRKSVQELLSLEYGLYEEFGRCAGQLSPSDAAAIDEEWDSYFLMQHHGVPTRLLDWTDGALGLLAFRDQREAFGPDYGLVCLRAGSILANRLVRQPPGSRACRRTMEEILSQTDSQRQR